MKYFVPLSLFVLYVVNAVVLFFFQVSGSIFPLLICAGFALLSMFALWIDRGKSGCFIAAAFLVIAPATISASWFYNYNENRFLNAFGENLVHAKNKAIYIEYPELNYHTVIAFEINAGIGCKGKYDTVYLNNRGGGNDVANYLISRLQGCGVNRAVAVGWGCASSCTGIWAAMPIREIEDGAELMFHQTNSLLDVNSRQPLLEWYSGVFPEVVVTALATVPPDKYCFLSKADIYSFGMFPDVYLKQEVSEVDVLSKCRSQHK